GQGQDPAAEQLLQHAPLVVFADPLVLPDAPKPAVPREGFRYQSQVGFHLFELPALVGQFSQGSGVTPGHPSIQRHQPLFRLQALPARCSAVVPPSGNSCIRSTKSRMRALWASSSRARPTTLWVASNTRLATSSRIWARAFSRSRAISTRARSIIFSASASALARMRWRASSPASVARVTMA